MSCYIGSVILLFFSLGISADLAKRCLDTSGFYEVLSADEAFNCGLFFSNTSSPHLNYQKAFELMEWSYQLGYKMAAGQMAYLMSIGRVFDRKDSMLVKWGESSLWNSRCREQKDSVADCKEFVEGSKAFPPLPDCTFFLKKKGLNRFHRWQVYELSKESAVYGDGHAASIHGWAAESLGYYDEAARDYRQAYNSGHSFALKQLARLYIEKRTSYLEPVKSALYGLLNYPPAEWESQEKMDEIHARLEHYPSLAAELAHDIRKIAPAEAVKLCLAAKEHPDAKYTLGLIYEENPNLFYDMQDHSDTSGSLQETGNSAAYISALDHFEKASDKRHAKASDKAGNYHEYGKTGRKDQRKATYRYCIGFANGDMDAGVSLANMLRDNADSEKQGKRIYCYIAGRIHESFHSKLAKPVASYCENNE